MFNLGYTYKSDVINNIGFFDVGISYSAYYFVMFLSVPLLMELYSSFYGVDLGSIAATAYFRFDELYTLQSFLYALLGLISFVCGYYLVKNKTFHVPTIYKASWSSRKIFIVSLSLFTSGFVIKIYRYFSGAVDWGRFEGTIVNNPLIAFFISVNALHAFAILVIIIGYYESQKYGRIKEKKLFLRTALIMTFIFLLFSLDQDSKIRLLAPFLFLLIVRQFYHPASLKKLVIYVSILLIVIINVGGAIEAYKGNYKINTTIESVMRPFVVRVSQIQVLTQIIKETDQYLYGHTFMELVERFKPGWIRVRIVEGNEFGKKYGLINQEDDITGVAYTNVGDFYINFGLPGIAIGMALLGVLFRLIFNFIRQTDMFMKLIFPVLWITIIHGAENAIAVIAYKLIMIFFIMTIIHISLVKFSIKKPH